MRYYDTDGDELRGDTFDLCDAEWGAAEWGGVADVCKPEWSLVAFKVYMPLCSASIATRWNKESLKGEQALGAAQGDGSSCLLDFRHIRRSASVSPYQLPILCSLNGVLGRSSLSFSFLRCVGLRLFCGRA